MILPARDYQATHIKVPPNLHTGLDRIVHSAVGRYRSRSSVIDDLLNEAEQIIDRSLEICYVPEGKLREQLTQIQECFRRQSRGYEKHLPEALAIMTEISDRILGLRPNPVQIVGAMALYQGYLAEMATGEGKSLTACFPAVLAAWTGRPCHIITVNDYLSERDAHAFRQFYAFCGVSVGWVSGEMGSEERRANYEKGVVYTTSKEILADFLRDRLKLGPCHQPSRRMIRYLLQPRSRAREGLVMRGLDTTIVDEVDSVLIDEAVTPLIISHPQKNDDLIEACLIAQEIAETLTAPEDYHADLKYREIALTTSGRKRAEARSALLPGFWYGTARREELIIQALTAREFYHRDKQYVVSEDKVIIVDEFTGRLMPNRTWKHGLHQAVEAREGLELSDPSETLARLSFQRFFRFFRKLSGMTGTARDSAAEFWHIYGLPVLSIPTHRPCIRKQLEDRIFSCREDKWGAVVDEIIQWHETGRPVLVGTRSVMESERLAAQLVNRVSTLSVLNAVKHREEAEIVVRAGKQGMITIATNMAGRGTDIKLGRGVAALGGLHVIVTERHESRRIDRQLIGRCARQGDPGSARAFISMEDELIQRFVPYPVRRILSAAVEKKSRGAHHIAEKTLLYAQSAAQRLAFLQRRGVLHMDTWLEDVLSFTGSSLEN